MSSEHTGLLKTRAENFAHHLQNRLRSLGETEDNSWVDGGSPETEVYYDIDSSLASPQEELAEPLFILEQNQGFPLQRDESSDSQYFDTVEEQSTSSLRNPGTQSNLHLKTDHPHINSCGHENVESGCNRIHEYPSFDLEPHFSEIEITENNFDSSVAENNNRLKKDEEEAKQNVNICERTVEVDTRQENAEKTEETDSLFCVFCDIEQTKCNLTNGNNNSESKGSIRYDSCSEKEEKHVNNHQIPSNSENSGNNSENTVSLSDLLTVLKKEISNEKSQAQEETDLSGTNLQTDLPNIQVEELSPEARKKELDDEFDIETKRKNFRRCSSLKSGKTPPGTPGRKKIVRFADVFGLDLADVKTFLDEVPTVPKSAFEDLHGIELSTSPVVESSLGRITVLTSVPDKVLIPLFQQPCIQPNFLDRVRHNNVCLESAFVSDFALFAITGLVRVRNIDFHKSVYVRYSSDRWKSFSDLQARYVPNSCDGFSDKFTFILYAHTLTVGQKLEFALRYHTSGSQFWDSNGGMNYGFECATRAVSDPGILPSPMENSASFY